MRIKKQLSAVDALVIDYYETREFDDKSWSAYCAALRAAEAAHGCKLIVIDGVLYELKRVYGVDGSEVNND